MLELASPLLTHQTSCITNTIPCYRIANIDIETVYEHKFIRRRNWINKKKKLINSFVLSYANRSHQTANVSITRHLRNRNYVSIMEWKDYQSNSHALDIHCFRFLVHWLVANSNGIVRSFRKFLPVVNVKRISSVTGLGVSKMMELPSSMYTKLDTIIRFSNHQFCFF